LDEKLPDYIQHIITDFVTQIELFDKQISAVEKLRDNLLPEADVEKKNEKKLITSRSHLAFLHCAPKCR